MSNPLPGFPPGRAALLIAHPGHELRIHGWVERSRPLVFALTDGSGHGSQSRLASTVRVLDRAGARTGAVFGRFTDLALYRAVLDGQAGVFTDLADEIGSALVAEGVTHLVADAAEGYNPSHDLCRYIADTASALAGFPADSSFEFDLVAAPERTSRSGAVHVHLDDDALARKLETSRAYLEMAAEVESALTRWGENAFRCETFHGVPPDRAWRDLEEAHPFYERHGERRRAERVYREVVRFADHVRPLRDALRQHAVAGLV